MAESELTKETLRAADLSSQSRSTIPSITVLFHPDPRRVGGQARLANLIARKPVALCRTTPLFRQPGEERDWPLADPFISRRPVQIERRSDGAIVITVQPGGIRVTADGAAIVDSAIFLFDRVRRGVVLELSGRVVLLLHHLAPPVARPPTLDLVGASEAIDAVRASVQRVADLPVPVLIRGETGTGKELVAQAIHRVSRRADRPCIRVNMAAIPSSTAASELFGHAKGAFTGAVAEHKGYFHQAHGGTLLLDEIGAAPPEVQQMLLRVLEVGELQPLGSVGTRTVDVRLIAATDADLEEATSSGTFRAALLHRLEGYQIFVPALRERPDDIGRLLIHFLREELQAVGESERLDRPADGSPTWLPASLVARLVRLDWPGNVRQLRNVVRQLVIASRGLAEVHVDAAASRLIEAAEGETQASPERTPPGELTEDELTAALRANDWQPGATATALGISRSSLYQRMRDSKRIRKAEDIGREEILRCQEECGGDPVAMARRLEISKRTLQLRMKSLGIL